MKVLTQMIILLFCVVMFSGIALAEFVNEQANEQASEQVGNIYTVERTADGRQIQRDIVINEYDAQATQNTNIVEDTDIMATIIDKIMGKKFPGEYMESGFFDSGCQGIVLKDYGVLFMMKVGFPLIKLSEDKQTKEAKPDSLWDQTKRELKEGHSTFAYGHSAGSVSSDNLIVSTSTSFDQAKVERLKNELMKLIADYSSNIRDIKPNDNITIVIKGGGKYSTDIFLPRFDNMRHIGMNSSSSSHEIGIPSSEMGGIAAPALPNQPNMPVVTTTASGISSGIIPVNPSSPVIITESTGVPVVPVPQWSQNAVQTDNKHITFLGQRNSRSTMIVVVKKRNVTDFKEGRINSDEFAKRAEIIQY